MIQSVVIRGKLYRVIVCPDRLIVDGERYEALVDHEDEVVWLCPGISEHYRPVVAAAAAERIAAEDAQQNPPRTRKNIKVDAAETKQQFTAMVKDRFSMTQKVAITRLLAWFMRQDRNTQLEILVPGSVVKKGR